MATCVHASPCTPILPVLNKSQSHQHPRNQCVLPLRVKSVKLTTNALAYRLNGLVLIHGQHEHSMKYQQGTSVCLLGGKGNSENEGSGWNPFEKVMGSFKGKSIEDVLRQQIEKQEFYGGSGKNPPRAAAAVEMALVDLRMKALQESLMKLYKWSWLLLSLSFCGEELTRLAKDYVKYLLRGSKSVRLKRAMHKWKRFYQKLNEKKVVDKMWLERAIISTPTAYDSPAKYRQIFKSFLASNVE